MNRTIKFRAWDKKNKKMRDMKWLLKEVTYEEESWLDFIIWRGDYTFTGIWVDEKPNDYKHSDFEVMQFTGLTDKNGKEIYFGDILATSNDNPEHDIWNKEDYGYTIVEEGGRELGVDFSNWYVDTEDDESIYSLPFIEVIGNTYENPNLLKDKPNEN